MPNFEIVRRIGAGGFSTVYEAVDTQVDGRVALKVLRVDLSDERGRERFEREGRTMGRLREVNGIVSVYRTTYTTDGRPVIVMAYCPKGSLADRLRTDGPLDVERVKVLGTEIASALAVAHAHGIFHRDIKPENILETQSGHYALSDFGIAAVDGYRGSTETASTLTPPHAPPERFTDTNGQEVSAAGDIYSLGSTLHMLLTGRPPFGTAREGGIAALAQRVMTDAPAPIDRVGVSSGLVSAIRKALAKDPRDRFVDAQAFANALQLDEAVIAPSVSGGVAAELVPDSTVDPTERPINPMEPVSYGPVDEEQAKIVHAPLVPAKELLKGPRRPGRRSRGPWVAVGVVALCIALVGAIVARSGDDATAGTDVAGISSIKYPLENQGAVSNQRVWQFASADGTELDGSLTASRVPGEDPRGAALVEFVPSELVKDLDAIRWSVKPSKIDVVSGRSGTPGKGVGSTPTGAVVRFALGDSESSTKVTYRVSLPKGAANAARLNRFNIAREAFKIAACRAATNSCGSIPVPESLAFWPSLPIIGVGQVFAANPLLFETNTDKSLVPPGTVTGVKWSVTESSIASVDANGQVTGISEGFAHVQATIEGLPLAVLIVGVTKDHVPVVAKLKITGPGKIVDGRADGRPAKYSANPLDRDGKVVPGVVVTWTVSPPTAGTVDVQGTFSSLVPVGQSVRAVINASLVNAAGNQVSDVLQVTVSATTNPPKDEDSDGTLDDQDQCRRTFGLPQFGGCPDDDGDGTPEPPDACSGVSGVAQFTGCPDTDNDGIPEPPDACPGVRGLPQFAGCPDTDNDGVPEPPDACPGVTGSLSNGCNPTVTPLPDLKITRIFWDGPTNPAAGDCVQFRIEIQNIGTAPSPNIKHGILLYLDGGTNRDLMPWSAYYTSGLAVGETRIQDADSGRGDATCNPSSGEKQRKLWKAIAGNHTIEAWVDDHENVGGEGLITEISGENNRLRVPIRVL